MFLIFDFLIFFLIDEGKKHQRNRKKDTASVPAAGYLTTIDGIGGTTDYSSNVTVTIPVMGVDIYLPRRMFCLPTDYSSNVTVDTPFC